MMRFDGRRILVLGLGESGLAVARFVDAGGGLVRVADTRVEPPSLARLRLEVPRAEFVAGPLADALLDDVALVVASPGLSPSKPPLASFAEAARARALEVIGEIELFARALAALREQRGYAPRIVGITGTNGKTTTTRIAARMIERAGMSVRAAGNISPSALEALLDAMASDRLPQAWVLELSSFQLATTSSLACDAAAVLNLSEDHLDWHPTLADYAAAKARIFAPSTIQVLNRDVPAVMAMAARKARVLTFGTDAPTQPDQFGLVHDAALTWLAVADDAGEPGRRRRAAAELPGIPGPVFVQRLMPADALHIRGRHNAANALAALALVRAIGCPLAPVLHALRDYRGEPHRTEAVATVGGVVYYDDSKGTNVGATVAAIEGLGAELRDGRLVVILGGDGKGQGFAPLAAPLQRYGRAAILIGRDAPGIESALAASGVALRHEADLGRAVQAAAGIAQPGDAVVLSPACASFDMFRDYRHRAEVFVAAVREIAASAGQPC
ncbi:MAG TPA: UDP-N-acetylmuramoyl-L-alanine--D-glutamate ligase [Burkholderiaceae bacterium]|nr:UDP-N-acetylmuramoyl-L-alanine--D-glutamate ligase [Burkholderiaceae bacterium]